MESDWRYGVYEVGWMLSDVTYVAVVAVTIPGPVYALLVKGGPAGDGFYTWTPASLPVFFAPYGPTFPGESFPWGVGVFTDDFGIWP